MEWLTEYFGAFSTFLNWRTIADVVLLTGLVFFLLRSISLLGTTKIFYGLLAALLLFLVAKALGLKGMNWVFANFAHVALLGAIIVFQPEIRRLLERAGSYGSNPRGRVKGDLASMKITEVAFSLAEKRWGALFVLPGKESIQPWISNGVVANASVSEALVMSLFDPHSPGHDGAAIIEGGKISHFSVRLPLSESGKLSNHYGTRHHAAMGLSEVTDAMVVAVSEERGRVSIFCQGEMTRVNDAAEAVSLIRKHLDTVAAFGFPTTGHERFGGRWAQIVVSFLVAVLFCTTVMVSQAEIREKVFSVPVEYLTSREAVLGGGKVSEVRLHLKGPKSELDLLSPSDLAVRMDLTRAGPGKADVIITGDNLRLPRGISLLDVEPEFLSLTLYGIREKEALVDPQFVGSLPEGLILESFKVTPLRVKVLSSDGELDEGEPHVTTTPVYLSGIRGNTRILCKIIAPPSIQPVQKSWPDAEVEIRVSGAGEEPPQRP